MTSEADAKDKKKYIVEFSRGEHRFMFHPCETRWEANAIASQAMLFNLKDIAIVEENV